MSSLDTLRYRLSAHKKHWGEIARLGNVSRSTFNKIAYGYTASPGIDTVEKISRGLDAFLFGDNAKQ